MYKATIIAFTTLLLASSTFAAPTPNSGIAPRAAQTVPTRPTGISVTGCPTPNDIQACVLWVASQRSKALEGQAKASVDAIKAKNDQLAKLNQQLAELRAKRAASTDPEEQKALDKLIEDTKNTIDQLSSSSQLDMVQLQSIMSKHNSAVEMLSNTIKKTSDSQSSIIRNIN